MAEPSPSAPRDSLLDTALPPDTRFIDALAVDVNGLLRGKRLRAESWPAALREGIAFSASALILDAHGASQGPLGLGTADGDPDAKGQPVPGSLQPVPWAGEAVAQVLLEMRGRDGRALWYDPRAVLRGVIDRCREDGLFPVVSCELEFYLVGDGAEGQPVPLAAARGGVTRVGGNHLCPQALEDFGPFLHALHAALLAQGIPADALVGEYGPAQFELNLRHTPDPLLAADWAVLQRRATIGVAARHGMRATFMPKPFAGQAGSGLHVHVSLVDEAGRNRFGAPGGEALLRAAIAGMQRFHAQSMALFAPSFGGYRRFRPGSFVALNSAWGEDSRAVAFRVPRSGPEARRIEHRLAGADASPHLVMAAILAAIHYGITEGLAPADTAVRERDPALPCDIFSALRDFAAGAELARYLPADFARLFSALKQAEAASLFSDVQPAEYGFYL